jgi:thiamine-phosphate pyrophosphorylase
MIPRLVFVTDGARGSGGRPLQDVIARAFEGGVEAVILRERGLEDAALCAHIEALAPLRARGLRVLVSRRLDLARAYALDGVQLTADSVPVAEARSWLGGRFCLGFSAHSGEEARRAEDSGADYVTLSPIYPTDSKSGASGRGTSWLAHELGGLGIPALALGGVTAERVPEVLGCGAWGVAAVAAIGAAVDVEQAARKLKQSITEKAA